MSRKRQYLNLGGEGDDFDKRSVANSEWTLDLGLELEEGTSGNINHGNELNELKWAAFEVLMKLFPDLLYSYNKRYHSPNRKCSKRS
jgi:hypothetical protein